MTHEGSLIEKLSFELAQLTREYDEEVISHDIEEKELKRKLDVARQHNAKLLQQVKTLFAANVAYREWLEEDK